MTLRAHSQREKKTKEAGSRAARRILTALAQVLQCNYIRIRIQRTGKGKEKIMVRKGTVVLVAAAALSVLVLTGCYRTPEQRAEYMVKHLSSKLDLNDTQKAKLERIKDEFLARRPDMARMREETVKEANELMRSAEIDQTRLNALMEKSHAGATDMIMFVSAKFTEIHDMLTPEQREKLAGHIEEYMHHGNR
jgi:Spy/CpxP family protein refolding chaperone